MVRDLVLTLTGPDRIGLVEGVTRLLLERGGNVATSRMARLGGEFAILMLVELPEAKAAGLGEAVEALLGTGYKLTVTDTAEGDEPGRAGWPTYQIEVSGADHEGIIHEVASYLSGRGINIESMDTETAPAPVTGAPLFLMSALVAVPPELDEDDWHDGLDEVADRQNVEIRVAEVADE